MEYFRDRMGYRLVLRDANASEWVGQDGTLRFEGKIQNVGFGNVVNRKNVSVLLKAANGSGVYTALTDLDARNWLVAEDGNSRADNTAAWRDLNFSIEMSAFGNVPVGEYDIYLKINDPKETSANRRCIQFANYDIWNADLGANKIGSTSIRQGQSSTQKPWKNPFEDVQADAWYYSAIEYVHSTGLTTGTSDDPMLFSPDMPLTRGMLTAILYRQAGSPEADTNSFSDVPAGQYYAAAVSWAAKAGIVTGTGDNQFKPEDAITREELAVILYRYSGSPAVTDKFAGFHDADRISDWAKQAVAWALEQGVMTGDGEMLLPGASATRAETAAMLQRFFALSA